LSIFHSTWWLDAAAPGLWRESVVIAPDGRLRGRWPYIVQRRAGLTRLLAPPLTMRLGPLLVLGEGKQSRQIAERKELLLSLAEQLPPHDQFLQFFHPAIDYWIPLSWRGFTQTTLYSYTLEDLSNLDTIWNNFDQEARARIRKEKKSLTVRSGLGSDLLYDLISETLRRGGTSISYSRETLGRVHDKCIERNQGRVFSAHNRDGDLVAALFLVWDEQTAYYLLAGCGEEGRRLGAPSLLVSEAIEFAATVTKQFDFEGSSLESIEHHLRGFGGRPIPFSRVERRSNRAQALLAARDLSRFRRRV
jgi:Acetyltransferase (GNAT) domain